MKYTLNRKDLHERIARRMRFLAEYDFRTTHKPGEDNGPADFLPRPIQNEYFIMVVGIEDNLSHLATFFKQNRAPQTR